jgi:predicted RNA-binding Zn ribbon-like protein
MDAEQGDHALTLPGGVLPSNLLMPVTPTAAGMRLDGGHPALDLVNTVYGQIGEPPEHDVLATPEDLVTFAGRVGMAGPGTPAAPRALAAAQKLRDALDAVLHAHLAAAEAPELAEVEAAARAAMAAARLDPADGAYAWTWPERDPLAPVHRLALAAVELLRSEDDLGRLHRCAACRWFFLDRSRGAGRRWCSMADCGTEAKKRRYVARRRERRAS